jgi:nickel transport protein
MKRLTLATALFLAVILGLAPAGHAHRVNIFAYVDGDTIVTESGYSRTSRVYDGKVEVFDNATGALLLSGDTDTEGRFTFPIPEQARTGSMDLKLLLTAGTGHQADWVVKGSEIKNAETPADAATTDQASAAPAVAPAVTPSTAEAQPAAEAGDRSGLSEAQVARIEAAVRRELAPVKQMLAELSQPGPGVTEIAGGIGYILGIFGIAAYMKSRSPRKDRS